MTEKLKRMTAQSFIWAIWKRANARRWRNQLVQLLVVLAQVNASAQIAVRASDYPSSNFRGQLKARLGLETYVSHLIEHSPEQDQSKLLLRHLERAQRAYLTGSLEEARSGFIQLTQLAHGSDWKTSQRQVIFLAFLRSAQLASSPQERRELLASGAAFAADLAPDPDLIAPPLVAEFNTVKRDLNDRATAVSIRERFADFDVLQLNGRTFAIATTSNLVVMPGSYRVRLLSNRYEPQTQVLTHHQLASLQPTMRPLVKGTCDRPRVTNSLEKLSQEVSGPVMPVSSHQSFNEPSSKKRPRSTKKADEVLVFYDDECLQVRRNGQWSQVPVDFELGTQPELESIKNTEPTRSHFTFENQQSSSSLDKWKVQHGHLGSNAGLLPNTENFEKPVSRQPIYKRKWFWIAISGIVAAATIVRHNNQRERVQEAPPPADVRPTQQTGY